MKDPTTPESNGAFPVEDTSELRVRASDHIKAAGPEGAAELATALFEKFLSGNAPPPPPPPVDIKPRVNNWWIRLAVGAVITSASAFAAYQVTEARSVSNQDSIKRHESLPSHPAAQEEFRLIKVDISKIAGEVGKIENISKGIDTLKREAQTHEKTRLEEKVKALERENRRLERGVTR